MVTSMPTISPIAGPPRAQTWGAGLLDRGVDRRDVDRRNARTGVHEHERCACEQVGQLLECRVLELGGDALPCDRALLDRRVVLGDRERRQDRTRGRRIAAQELVRGLEPALFLTGI